VLGSTEALGNPRHRRVDDRTGLAQGLRKHAYRLGGLPVSVGGV